MILQPADHDSMKKLFIPLMLALFGMLSACSQVTLIDVSEVPEYKPIIGAQYEIVGDVFGYGIRDYSAAPVEYISLVPPPGFMGSQVGFKIPLKYGSKIKILKVMSANYWFECHEVFIVTMTGTSMPADLPIRLEMIGANKGDSCLQLNPSLYRSLGVD